MLDNTGLETIRQQVCAGEKYAGIEQGLVTRLIQEEAAKGRNGRELVKAVRSRLHQSAAVYRLSSLELDQLIPTLQALPRDLHAPEVKNFCTASMRLHQSSLERLASINEFFQTTLQSIAPVTSILDLACGLNPLAVSWMPLGKDFTYIACDIFSDQLGLLDAFFAHFAIDGHTAMLDLTRETPTQSAQVTFVLKTLPCLEQLSRNIGPRLLEAVPSDHILVSFPARSLGGKNKGMLKNYEQQFMELLKPGAWDFERFIFPNELAFLLHRKGA